MFEANVAPVSVLIVEDDPVTRRKIGLAIESHAGLRLVGALESVAAAIDWLTHCKVDVLLTDLGLPDGSGLDIIRACRKRSPKTDIMVITMASDEENVLGCIEAGATGYILKDAAKLDIVQGVLDLCSGGAPMSPEIARMVIARIRKEKKAKPLPDVEAVDASGLSRREAAILELIARGHTYNESSKLLNLSVGTVQSHIKHIYRKLSVHSRSEAVYEAHRRGYLQMTEAEPLAQEQPRAAPEAAHPPPG